MRFDMKGSGALERIENNPIAASTLPTDTHGKQIRQQSIWQKITLSH